MKKKIAYIFAFISPLLVLLSGIICFGHIYSGEYLDKSRLFYVYQEWVFKNFFPLGELHATLITLGIPLVIICIIVLAVFSCFITLACSKDIVRNDIVYMSLLSLWPVIFIVFSPLIIYAIPFLIIHGVLIYTFLRVCIKIL